MRSTIIKDPCFSMRSCTIRFDTFVVSSTTAVTAEINLKITYPKYRSELLRFKFMRLAMTFVYDYKEYSWGYITGLQQSRAIIVFTSKLNKPLKFLFSVLTIFGTSVYGGAVIATSLDYFFERMMMLKWVSILVVIRQHSSQLRASAMLFCL